MGLQPSFCGSGLTLFCLKRKLNSECINFFNVMDSGHDRNVVNLENP